MPNFNDTNFDDSKLKRGSILYSSKISPVVEGEYALFNAYNMSWEGYKMYDQEFSYTGDVLSYIETQLDSKSTSSGEIWDDIKDNEYITSQINIYASYTSNKIAPDIVWQNSIGNDTYSSLPSSSSDAQGWYTSIDIIPGSNKYVWMSSIYIVKSLSNNILGYRGPSSTPIYLPSESGINGNFKSTVFCRTNETPKAPTDGAVYNTGVPTTPQVYKASDSKPITGVEWSDGIPSGQEILWASTGIIKDSSPETTVWTTPRQMTDTATYDVEFAKKQTNDAIPATPTDSNRHGGNDTQIWFDPTKDASQNFTQMYWRAERECINGEWGDWVIVRIKGEQGTAGIKGDFKSTVFKRSEDIPETPSGGDYDHPVPSGWSDGIPNGTGPVWSTWKTFSVNGNNSSWTTPTLVADTPTYDVEFSPNDTKPEPPSDDKTQREGQGWYDPNTETQVNWENMIWRAERNRATTQDAWSEWVITKIKGEDGHVDLDVPYYEQRWKTFESTASVPDSWNSDNLPSKNDSNINIDNSNGWTLIPNYSNGGIVYMTSCKVIIDVIDNVQTKGYIGDWSTPIRVTGIDGKANPIQPVLKYQWYNTNEYSNAPSCSINSENPGNNWLETPGNPSGENKYLWMIQGQRQDNSMQTIDGTNYWTSPVCLSGADGEPGVDGDDIEFIYHRYDTVPVFGDNNNNPNHWAVSSQDNYLGPTGYEWTNHPTGVTLSNKYEYCSYRRKTGATGNKQWTTFSEPFAWSIYGENGIDGDGVEYIYAVTPTDAAPTQPVITSTNYEASQQSEWGVDNLLWFDDPQKLDNNTQKYQWVSVRKYRYPKQNETLGGNELDHNKKYWFPYSRPQLWNWYVNNGTNAPQIAMVYKRNNSGTTAPGLPNITNNKVKTSKIYSYSNASHGSWASSPGNSDDNYSYLWMTSIYYTSSKTGTDGQNNELNLTYINYTVDDYTWQTPVCLTGESGHDGEDGSDIEFIYYRTADDNKTFNDGWDHFGGDSSENDWPFVSGVTNYGVFNDDADAGISYIGTLQNGKHADVWTDNPLGVSSTYDYEYASIRKKVRGTWGDFCKPFLWSKYGEDGVDGDGVEYIFYRSDDENEVTFDASLETGNNNSSNNPANWEISQDPEYRANSRWSDDPSGVSINNRWEYVSVRHKRFDAESNTTTWGKYSEPSLWAHFAVNGLATNLVLESDNDNITVGINSDGLVNNNYQDTTTFRLVYNTRPLTLSSDYELSMSNPDSDLFNLSNNTLSFNSNSGFSGTFALLNGNTLTISVPEGFDLAQYDYIMSITFIATITNQNIEGMDVDTTAVFTLKISGVELSINDIYKLNIDRQVIKLNPNNDAYDTINISLKSLTSVNSITSNTEATNKHLYIRYNVSDENNLSGDGPIISQNNKIISVGNYTPNKYYNKHTFRLYYILDDDFINNSLSTVELDDTTLNNHGAVLLDTETISAVWDGANGNPGTDSKAQEYIYFVTDDISYFESGNHANINPNNWDTHENVTINGVSYYAYLTDDFPFVNEQTSYLGWEDTHIGISEEHPYQFMSTREYNTATKEWGKFSSPKCSHNWGHSGEDGDGVEYIYYRSDSVYSSWVGNEHPANWFKRTGEYQSSEYIHSNATSIWKDNPQGVTSSNKYEYISIRKYKKLSYKDWNNFALTCKTIGSGVPLASQLNRANTNIPVTFTSDEQLYNLRDTIITLLNQNVLYGDTWQLNCGAGSLEILNAVISSITDNEKYWTPYSEPSLWAKYGEKGATGDSGGSGLTFDFDNPSIQIAVNSNGKIKDNQEVITYLNVYEGASKIPANNITLSIISDGTHAAFEHSYSDTDKYGYTLFNSNSSDGTTYYTWKIGDVDINNIGDNNIVQLTENSSIEFNISYNNKDYVKRVSLVPIQYGEDGANAVVFDLYCPTSVIHYNAMTDTPSFNPITISDIKVRRIENGNVNYTDTEGNNRNKNGFAISYYATLPLAGSQETGGNTGSSEEGTIGRKTSPQLANYIFGYTYDGILDINDKINTALNDSKLYDIPKTVKLSLYHTENGTASLWDESDLEIIYDGINGTDSFAEEFIYSITYVPGETSGGEDPSDWDIRDSRDYIPDNQTNYWKDHPQGVSQEHPIEWMSHRIYNYENKTWNRYEAPVKWSHYGENGKDGDGIEYIYWRPTGTTIQTWDPDALSADPILEDPRTWDTTTSEFQASGYLGPTGSHWTDDPTGVTAENSYEYVSQRKYNGSTKSWGAFSMPAVWTHYGQKGDTGNPGADAYVIDWTNDQINLAVDENGYIISGENGQLKETSININSLNGVFGDTPTIKMNWYTSGDEMPYKKFTKNYSEGVTNTINANTIGAGIAPSSSQIVFSHGNINSNNNYPLKITVGKDYPGNKAYIPENGIEIKVKVSISGNEKSISNVDKILRICGQHIPSDGQNSVTYELDVTPNALSYSSFSQNANVTINALKYNGTSVTRLSTSEDFEDNNIYFKKTLYDITLEHSVTDSTYDQSNSKSISKTFASRNIYNTRYVVITMYHENDGTYTQIDSETIPVIYDGEQGAQGFTGPIVRMRGEWTANTKYGNGEYNSNYDGTSLLYKDIVIWNSHYMTPNSSSKYITTTNDNSGLCQGSAYVSSNTFSATEWIVATQYDFIATKLLYADQALINQISTHDLIATNQDGYPVAGVTSGSKMYDKNNTEIVSYLSTLGTVNYSENTVQSQNDPSNVRIFAGEIWDGINSYSLTYAPFNVRQDGTAYMSKAIIEGTVTASNLKLKENVNANTQDQKGSFTYWDIINGDRYVPNLNEGEVGLYYILSIYGNSNSNIRIKTPYPGDNVPRNAFFKKSINGKSVLSGNSSNDDIYMRPPKNTLCQLVGINADNITYWNIIETPLAEQKIPDTILEHYDCTDDVILFAYNLGDYYTNNNTVKISYLCTRADDYDGFLPIRKVTFEGGSGTDADDVWVEYTFLTYLQSDSSKHTTNGAYANLGFLKYVKDKYQSWQPEGEPVNPNS